MNLIKLQIEDLNNQSVTDYCRQLVKDQFHPETRVEVYRGDMLCLIVTNIEEAAKIMPKDGRWVKFDPKRRKKAANSLTD